MRLLAITLLAAPALAACNAEPEAEPETPHAAATTAATPRPDLARCEAAHVPAEGYGYGDEPIAVPADFTPFMAASETELAILTQTGSTICWNLGWISHFDIADQLVGERLLGLQYAGFESFGYLLVDRAGEGSITDTGARPVFSPDGRRLAALQISDSGWGGMEGFGIWELSAATHRALARQVAEQDNDWTLPPPLSDQTQDWRLDGWRGNGCVGMSALPLDPKTYQPLNERRTYFASEANGWQVMAGTCP